MIEVQIKEIDVYFTFYLSRLLKSLQSVEIKNGSFKVCLKMQLL